MIEEKSKIISINDYKIPHKKSRKKKQSDGFHINKKHIITVVSILLFVCAGIFVIKNRYYDSVALINTKTWDNDLEHTGNPQNFVFDDTVVRFTNDGVSVIDMDFNIMWTYVYNIKNPKFTKTEKNFIIYGLNENNIYIFNKYGFLMNINTIYPIIRTVVSKNLYIYTLLDSIDGNIVNVFDSLGTKLDIEIKSHIEIDGNIIDIDISDDATKLIASYLYIDNDKVSSRVVFYDFSNVGKNNKESIVAGFDQEFKNVMVAKTVFFDDRYAFAISNIGITFFELRLQNEVNLVKHITFADNIKSIDYNDEKVILIFEKLDENNFYKNYYLLGYNKQGNVINNINFEFEYDNVFINKNYVLFTNNNELIIYDNYNRKRFDKNFEFEVIKADILKSFLFNDIIVYNGKQTIYYRLN